MKKIITILLLCISLFLIVACGDVSNPDPVVSHIHDWIPATCKQLKTCSTCGIETGMLAEHTWEDATCITLKTCSVCEKTEGDFAEHVYEESITVEATCTSKGVLTKTCTVCGDSKEEEIGRTLHKTTKVHDLKSVCSTCGFEDYTMACTDALIDYIPKLKDPSSFKLNAIYAGDYHREYNQYEKENGGNYVVVIFQASAKNSYGANVTKSYVYLYDIDNKTVIKDLEAKGENEEEKNFGINKLKGIEMQLEASYLISNATKNFVKQEGDLILYFVLNYLAGN